MGKERKREKRERKSEREEANIDHSRFSLMGKIMPGHRMYIVYGLYTYKLGGVSFFLNSRKQTSSEKKSSLFCYYIIKGIAIFY